MHMKDMPHKEFLRVQQNLLDAMKEAFLDASAKMNLDRECSMQMWQNTILDLVASAYTFMPEQQFQSEKVQAWLKNTIIERHKWVRSKFEVSQL